MIWSPWCKFGDCPWYGHWKVVLGWSEELLNWKLDNASYFMRCNLCAAVDLYNLSQVSVLYYNMKHTLHWILFFHLQNWLSQVRETKEKAMTILTPYRTATPHNQMVEGSGQPQEPYEIERQPFVSLLEFLSEIYQVGMLYSNKYLMWLTMEVVYGLLIIMVMVYWSLCMHSL